MDRSYLDVNASYVDEAPIQELFLHSFVPFSSSALNKGDEIRIAIQNRDVCTLPSESFIYIEGQLTKPTDLASEVVFSQNGLANLFSEIKYEINSVEIQRVKKPGVTSTLKGYCSYTPADINCLQNAAWDSVDGNNHFVKNGSFSGCIPLKHILGFAEDYKRILVNCSQQLILNRSLDDMDSLMFEAKGGEDLTHADTALTLKVKSVEVKLTKVVWRVPVVKVNDEEKLKLLKIIDSKQMISCSFRNWELCEYPNVPETKKHSWMVKSCSRVEKPRCLILAFLAKIPNALGASRGDSFDTCSLTSIKAYINSVEYPYENFNESFDKNLFTMFYQSYADFQKYYYERLTSRPYLSREKYQEIGPFICIDCSRQNDDAKTSTIDLRIEFEAEKNFPANTTAYCLVFHDRVIQYSPFTGEVRKV